MPNPRFRCLSLAVGLLALYSAFPLIAQTPQPAGPRLHVNTLTSSLNNLGGAAWRCDADVTMVVWWSDESAGDDNLITSIQGRFFSGRTPTGPQFQVNDIRPGVQIRPRVRALDNGDFGVAWETGDIVHSRVYERTTLAPRAEVTLETLPGHLEGFDIVDDGRIAAVYRQNEMIQGQIFDAAGQPQGTLFEVELTETNFGTETFVGILVGAESVIIYWMVEEVVDSMEHRRLAFQRFSLDGNPLGPKVTVETQIENQNMGTILGSVFVELLETGDILFGYRTIERITGGGNIFRLFLERFDDAGQQDLDVLLTETMEISVLNITELLVEPSGDFLVAYVEGTQLLAQRFEADQQQGGPRFPLIEEELTHLFRMELTRNGPGNAFAVAWDDGVEDLYLRRFKSFPDILHDGFESGDTSRWCVARSAE